VCSAVSVARDLFTCRGKWPGSAAGPVRHDRVAARDEASWYPGHDGGHEWQAVAR